MYSYLRNTYFRFSKMHLIYGGVTKNRIEKLKSNWDNLHSFCAIALEKGINSLLPSAMGKHQNNCKRQFGYLVVISQVGDHSKLLALSNLVQPVACYLERRWALSIFIALRDARKGNYSIWHFDDLIRCDNLSQISWFINASSESKNKINCKPFEVADRWM